MAGTTVDEGNLVYKTMHQALREAGHDLPLAEVLREAAGKKKWTAIQDLLALEGADSVDEDEVERIFMRFNALLHEAYQTLPLRPQPGAEEVFRKLREKGIRIVLNTGYSRETVNLILERLGWVEHPHIDDVISVDDVKHGRPAPDMIHLAMEKVGLTDPKQVGKVGDAMIDVEEGRNAGCSLLVGVTTGAHTKEQLASVNPTHILDRISDLLSFVV